MLHVIVLPREKATPPWNEIVPAVLLAGVVSGPDCCPVAAVIQFHLENSPPTTLMPLTLLQAAHHHNVCCVTRGRDGEKLEKALIRRLGRCDIWRNVSSGTMSAAGLWLELE
ncbi:hypothetical protein VTI74DRAFT_2851 [Chaetomium olivicolor]